MTNHTTLAVLALTLPLAILGCGDTGGGPAPVAVATASVPAASFTKNRPAEAPDLMSVKPTAKIGEAVTFLARVGGRDNPFVDGLAVFTVADPSLESCELMGDEDHCPIPWDYCCEERNALVMGSATIRIVDADGVPYPASAQGASGLAPLRYVVIDGVVSDRNDDGLFVVDASRIWIGGKPQRGNNRLGSQAGEENANVDPHDHDGDGHPDHDHDHH
jgi:hypothetical protein